MLVSAAGDTGDVFANEPATRRTGHTGERGTADPGWKVSGRIGGTQGRANSGDETRAMDGRVELELSPDPFVERLRIHCRLPGAPALLSVRIYDAEGGLVARLRDWEPAAFEEIVHWDGRHQDGRRCPPGLYVVSVQASADGRIVHGKAVVARQ